jgi:hypothetical protein
MRYDNNLKSFDFFKVVTIYNTKKKIKFKYLLMVIIGVSGNKYFK